MKTPDLIVLQKTTFQRFFIVLIIVCVNALPLKLFAQNKDEAAIRKVLEDQTNSWNSGSIEDFMKGYWDSDSLMFIGRKGVKYGYSSTLENYKKSYPDTAARGKLFFNILEIRRLSKVYYYVTGKWQLNRSIGDLEGYFTLLFKKIKNRWVIIADHSR